MSYTLQYYVATGIPGLISDIVLLKERKNRWMALWDGSVKQLDLKKCSCVAHVECKKYPCHRIDDRSSDVLSRYPVMLKYRENGASSIIFVINYHFTGFMFKKCT